MATICDSLLERGFCLDDTCGLRHNTSYFCLTCNIPFNSETAYNSHIRSPGHAQALDGTEWLRCVPCDRHYRRGSLEQLSHENSIRHARRVENHPVSAGPPVVDVPFPPNWTRCEACKKSLPVFLSASHDQSDKHLTRLRIFNYLNSLRRSEADQRGIVVQGSQNIGTAAPTIVSLSCRVQNPVSLLRARVSSAVRTQSLAGGQNYFSITTIPVQLPILIEPQNNLAVQVNFNPQGRRGQFEGRLEFVFRDQEGTFVITRRVKAVAGNEDLALLAPITPFQHPPLVVDQDDSDSDHDVVGGANFIAPGIPYLPERSLNVAGIPEEMRELLASGPEGPSIEVQAANFREQFLPETLDIDTFQQHWSSLVHAEHFQAKIELKRFNMRNVTLQRVNNSYRLGVPGLAERRPSVIVGDKIRVRPQTADPDQVWFKGVVHEVEATAVRVGFHGSFPHTPGTLYEVRFVLNPVPFRRMIQALNVDAKRQEVLFPQVDDVTAFPITAQNLGQPGIQLYNDTIGANVEQRSAINRVTQLPLGSPPFIIFGPPGTGKTVTVVECISQLLNNKTTRILACAPSNSASDLIAQRLIDLRALQTSELFRLNALGRLRITLPDTLVPYSLIHPAGHRFQVPSLDQLTSYRVIVTTCSTAALLYGVGVDPGMFTHVFIDEAGQGSEPEVMIPILTMAGPKTNIILSGDPKQLGPVIQSPVARLSGLNDSYLERLMTSPAYDEVAMRGISVIKLLQNFRSHESIISFPNQQFYLNELIAHAPQNIANNLLGWDGLVTGNFPVVFEAVMGEDMREGNSPSYFNPHEASLVRDYVQRLIQFGVLPAEIGIVAPYKAQVRKIRTLLEDNGITGITIGSVEQFQGQERRVIIISTVRSNKDLLSFDLRHTLGFVSNAKRLNVAIARAQSLLVVIGDPLVLGLDVLWRRFLYFIFHSGGWRGALFPWNPDADPGEDTVTFDAAEEDMREFLRRALEPESSDEADSVGTDNESA